MSKVPDKDAQVTITYGEFEDLMANKAVELAEEFYKRSNNDASWKKLVLDVTAMFAGDIVKELFKDWIKEKEDAEV